MVRARVSCYFSAEDGGHGGQRGKLALPCCFSHARDSAGIFHTSLPPKQFCTYAVYSPNCRKDRFLSSIHYPFLPSCNTGAKRTPQRSILYFFMDVCTRTARRSLAPLSSFRVNGGHPLTPLAMTTHPTQILHPPVEEARVHCHPQDLHCGQGKKGGEEEDYSCPVQLVT
jgi:hypothetical protein